MFTRRCRARAAPCVWRAVAGKPEMVTLWTKSGSLGVLSGRGSLSSLGQSGKGGKEERGRTSKLRNLSFISSVSCAQANGTWAFIQPRPNLFLELEPFSYGGQSARVQRRQLGTRGRGRGGCFARRDKCPRGVGFAILRRDVPHRHLVLSGGAGRIVEDFVSALARG